MSHLRVIDLSHHTTSNLQVLSSPDNGLHVCQIAAVKNDINEAPGEDADHMECQGDEEEKEVTVIAFTNAVVHPWAVMIKRLRKREKNIS